MPAQPPTLTRLAVSAAHAPVGIGGELLFEALFDTRVVVTGVPALRLDTGGAALCATAPGADPDERVVFRAVVAEGEVSAALRVVAVELFDGATIRDHAGRDADLSNLPPLVDTGGAPAALPVDGERPRLLSLRCDSGTGPVPAGGEIVFTARFDEPIQPVGPVFLTVGGLSTLPPEATQTAPDQLRFAVLVEANDGEGLASCPADPLYGDIADLAGNPAVLSCPPLIASRFDAVAPMPTVTCISGVGPVPAGTIVSFVARFGEPMRVRGPVELEVQEVTDAGTRSFRVTGRWWDDRAVQFDHTILAAGTGQLFVPPNALRGDVTDLAGNPMDTRFPGVYGTAFDTQAPKLVSLERLTTASVVGVGQPVVFRATFSEPVAGNPFLAVRHSPPLSTLTLAAKQSSAASFDFTWLPKAGDDGWLSCPPGALAGAVKDLAGNLASYHSPSTVDTRIDTRGPYCRMSCAPTTGPVPAGAAVVFTATFSEPVTLVGASALRVEHRHGASVQSRWLPAVRLDAQRYTYSWIVPDDAGGVVVATELRGELRDAVGNLATLPTGELVGPSLDGTAPTVTLERVPGPTLLGPGGVVRFLVRFSEPVRVAADGLALRLVRTPATPTGTAVPGVLQPDGSWVFTWTVGLDEGVGRVDVPADAVRGTVIDLAGNPARLTHAPLAGVRFDTVAPAATVTRVGDEDPIPAGHFLVFDAVFDEPVVATGPVRLHLVRTRPGEVRKLPVVGREVDDRTFRFRYQVTVRDGAGRIDCPANALDAVIRDTAGNLAACAHPAAAGARFDVFPPSVSVRRASGGGPVGAGQELSFLAVFSEEVVADGDLQLRLRRIPDVGPARDEWVTGSPLGPDRFRFAWIVPAAAGGGRIEVRKNSLDGDVRDLAGNPARLDHDAAPGARYDTVAPRVLSWHALPAPTPKPAVLLVDFSEVVIVEGAPVAHLGAMDGAYLGGSGTAHLRFDLHGGMPVTDTLVITGGAIHDPAGNAYAP